MSSLFQKVKDHMDWDDDKTNVWFATKNPLLGEVSPMDMMIMGRVGKLEKFIDNLVEEGK